MHVRPRMRSLLKTPAEAGIVRQRRATEGATAASLSDPRAQTVVRRKHPLSRRLRRRFRCLTSGRAVLAPTDAVIAAVPEDA